MEPVCRPLQRQASRALVANRTISNASNRRFATQCSRNWFSNDTTTTISTARQSLQNNAIRTTLLRQPTSRTFSTTYPLFKKDGSKKKSKNESQNAAKVEDQIDPADLTEMEGKIAKAVEKFKNKVSSIRTGGRFSPHALESLRVVVDKNSKQTVRLGDLAQVIPKGARVMSILAGDEEYIKPISSALSSSQLSLNPQPDARNALQLNVPIPPPTKESRDQELREVKDAMDAAAKEVKAARADQNQRIKKHPTIRPDDERRTLKKMDTVAATGQADLKKWFDTANKAIQQP